MDYDEDKDLLVTGSEDKSIAFIKLGDRRIIKKNDNLSNRVYGVKFIWYLIRINLTFNNQKQ